MFILGTKGQCIALPERKEENKNLIHVRISSEILYFENMSEQRPGKKKTSLRFKKKLFYVSPSRMQLQCSAPSIQCARREAPNQPIIQDNVEHLSRV